MGNVSLKVLEKPLDFLFKNGYEPCMLNPMKLTYNCFFMLQKQIIDAFFRIKR